MLPTVGQTSHSGHLVKIFPIGTWVFLEVVKLTVGINHHTGISSECCRDTEVGVTFWGCLRHPLGELTSNDDRERKGGFPGEGTCMSHRS